jgi:hypothetical protein
VRRRGASDPVTPERRAYVFARDSGCVVARLVYAHELGLELTGPCLSRHGRNLGLLVYVAPGLRDDLLTVAHVRDRGKGGRFGRRPSSKPRHLAAVCHGHHLIHPVIDMAPVRDAVDLYLEALEGPAVTTERPWERIARVRGRVDSSPSDQEGSDGP